MMYTIRVQIRHLCQSLSSFSLVLKMNEDFVSELDKSHVNCQAAVSASL